ncbi:MAG: dTMP kinase [Sphingomonadales bacterium]|nr:dTMP kinase [Sphingomonadales bacterium]NCQ20921.1 dTMP kinase [Sphingomonadales bacterium]NCT02678.1 dTMP kinase [Sphingomonadales bacterium]
MSALRGRFIAFEGGEGAGKSTQARLLAEALRARGYTVVTTREPGGTPGAEAIRDLLLQPPGQNGWPAQAEALLFAAARSDHVAHLIRPALGRGEWVICDRFVDSSRAYQGAAGELGDQAITALHAFGSDGLRPDRVILLEGDEVILADRLAKRGQTADAIEGRSAAYHRAVVAFFRELADADPQGFASIDGVGTPAAVHERILIALEDLVA